MISWNPGKNNLEKSLLVVIFSFVVFIFAESALGAKSGDLEVLQKKNDEHIYRLIKYKNDLNSVLKTLTQYTATQVLAGLYAQLVSETVKPEFHIHSNMACVFIQYQKSILRSMGAYHLPLNFMTRKNKLKVLSSEEKEQAIYESFIWNVKRASLMIADEQKCDQPVNTHVTSITMQLQPESTIKKGLESFVVLDKQTKQHLFTTIRTLNDELSLSIETEFQSYEVSLPLWDELILWFYDNPEKTVSELLLESQSPCVCVHRQALFKYLHYRVDEADEAWIDADEGVLLGSNTSFLDKKKLAFSLFFLLINAVASYNIEQRKYGKVKCPNTTEGIKSEDNPCMGYIHGYECPKQSSREWSLRSKAKCPGVLSRHATEKIFYSCIYDRLESKVVETCEQKTDFVASGNFYIKSGAYRDLKCPSHLYQPTKFYRNKLSHCQFQKSRCNGEGQQIYNNGDGKSDASCKCDTTQGYSLQPLTETSSNFNKPDCLIQGELHRDCDCYKRKCSDNQVLNGTTYECVNLKNGANTRIDLNITDENSTTPSYSTMDTDQTYDNTHNLIFVNQKTYRKWKTAAAVAATTLGIMAKTGVFLFTAYVMLH